MYQSIPSLTIPPGRPPGIRTSPLTGGGVGFSPNFLCPGDRDFGLEKFSTVPKEKCRNFSICFKETGGSLKSRCSCAVSYQFLQKQEMSTISLIIETVFSHFYEIFRSFKDNFCQCWIIIKVLSSTFGLFQG